MASSSPQRFSSRSSPNRALSISQILFSFKGRVPRLTWWLYGFLGPVVVEVLVRKLLGIFEPAQDSVGELVGQLVILLVLWPHLTVSVKRWHDCDKSGWWFFIHLVPLIGTAWAIIANGLLRGTPGPNRFGSDSTE